MASHQGAMLAPELDIVVGDILCVGPWLDQWLHVFGYRTLALTGWQRVLQIASAQKTALKVLLKTESVWRNWMLAVSLDDQDPWELNDEMAELLCKPATVDPV